MLITENNLKEIIREKLLNYFLNESRDYNQDILAKIVLLKDALLKKNLLSSAKYVAPDPTKKHRDFGLCLIRVDSTIGRGKAIKPKTIINLVFKLMEKIGLKKYFNVSDYDFDGRYCEIHVVLKPKYMNSQENHELNNISN